MVNSIGVCECRWLICVSGLCWLSRIRWVNRLLARL